MKKIKLGILALSVTALFQSCSGGSKNRLSDTTQETKNLSAKANAAPPPCVDCSTLNGVDETTAIQQVVNFAALKKQDNNTQKAASVFFTTDQLRQIDSLLTYELLNLPAAQQPDGVRFYFGCNSPPSGTTKLNVLIHLVSTRVQNTTGYPNKSTHADYYEHDAAFLKKPFGIQDNSSSPLDPNGHPIKLGTVYNAPGVVIPCAGEPGNYVDEGTAYTWAFTNRYLKSDTINTVSDWFRLCFIQYVFRTIYNNAKTFNGLRVYLALGDHKSYSYKRDIVLLVPVDKNNHDYPGCIGQLAQLPPSCDPNTDQWIQSLKEYFIEEKNWTKLDKSKRHNNKDYLRFPFFYSHDVVGGGYDNGELCPTHCP